MAEFLQVLKTNTTSEPQEFADFLVARNRLTESALERAERSANQTGERLVTVLSKLGLLSEHEVMTELSAYYRLQIVPESQFPETAIYADKINRRFLLLHHILPISEDKRGLVVAMADPGDETAVKALNFFSNQPILKRVAALTDIDTAIHRLYGNDGTAHLVSKDNREISEERASDDIDRLVDLASDAPVIKLVHSMIVDAVQQNASDIHIEPFEDRVRIRFRVDGVLREQATQPERLGAAISSRIKIMAKLNIAERRLPQDGALRFTVRGKDVDIRVSTSPTLHGESIVLRILDRDRLALDFKALGFDDVLISSITKLLQHPHGIILVTGPTGSGKTTTLYTALLSLNTIERKILTIEDPIEYDLDGINQQEVQPQINRNFAGALRSFLRQNPDIIMVGEIRDKETAETAVQAALTGHLILSTLHTNNASSAVTRLLDMGIENYLLTSTMAGVLAQRLVRRLCETCRKPYKPDDDVAEKICNDLNMQEEEIPTLYHSVGCPKCHGSGYCGRTTIVELLEVDDKIRHLIMQKSEARAIYRAAVANGMRTLYQHGLTKALAGQTSLEEVLRVTQEV